MVRVPGITGQLEVDFTVFYPDACDVIKIDPVVRGKL